MFWYFYMCRFQKDMFGLKGITFIILMIQGILDLFLMDFFKARFFGR